MDLYDEEDTSLKCAIKDKSNTIRNISQIVGGEASNTSKPSPTGIATDGEVGEPQIPVTLNVTKPTGISTVTSYDNLYLQQQDEVEKTRKNVTITSFLKPPTPMHPRSGSLGGLPPPESPAPGTIDYTSDHSTFSEANRELTRTPSHQYQMPETPAVESCPPTPNFDSCPPPGALREQDYRYLEAKTATITSYDSDSSAPKRARLE